MKNTTIVSTQTAVNDRAPSTDATLSSLTLSAGSLSPAFSSETTEYTANVAYGVASVNLTPTVTDGNAVVLVNGGPAQSGASSTVNLAVGLNTVTVGVVAENGAVRTHTLRITRAAPSSDATLATLYLTSVGFAPRFHPDVTSYAVGELAFEYDKVEVGFLANRNAKALLNGVEVKWGDSAFANLAVGQNTLTVEVTAEDGITTKTYTITVARAEAFVNTPPTVTVIDRVVQSGASVELSATASAEDDGQLLGYLWTTTSDVTLTDANRANPSFTAPTLAVNAEDVLLDFTVEVLDGFDTASDTMTVTVQSKKNVAPMAAAAVSGPVRSGSTVSLTAAGSTDADEGDTATLHYEWESTGETEGPALTDGDTATPSFAAPALAQTDSPVVYEYTVTVTDDDGMSDTAAVTVTVQPIIVIQPVAEAGPDQRVSAGTLVRLGPVSEATRDRGDLSYRWTSSDRSIVLSDPQGKNPTFIAPMVKKRKAIVFTVRISNAEGVTVQNLTDSATITVLPDLPPVAVIKAPERVTEGRTVTLDASGSTDGDRKIMVRWFQRDGITVDLGKSGPVARFVAPRVPRGQTSVTLRFTVMLSDGVNDPVRVPVNVEVVRAKADAPRATAAAMAEAEPAAKAPDSAEKVAQFTQTRVTGALSNQPDLGGVLAGGDGTANLTMSSMGGEADIATAPDKPFWLRVRGSWSTVGTAAGDYVLGAAGAHVKVGDGLALGVMAQVDHLATVDGLSVSEGTGWMLGPYVVAKLPDQPLTVQGRLLYGQTSNSVSPNGTFTDQFDGERMLASVGVAGELVRGDVTWRPSLQAAYASESTDAYTDGNGLAVAAGETAVGQIATGIDVTFPLAVASGQMTATLGLSDIWSGGLNGAATIVDGHRGKISAGINRSFGTGAELSITGSYDGIGSADYESFALDMLFVQQF